MARVLPPHAVIFLDASASTCYERIMKRGRVRFCRGEASTLLAFHWTKGQG